MRFIKAKAAFIAALLFFAFAGCEKGQSVEAYYAVPEDGSATGYETSTVFDESAALYDEEYSVEEIIEEIISLVETQEQAFITADTELMRGTINPADSFLITESVHLVADQKTSPVSEYQRSISNIYMQGAYFIGTLTQSFVYGGQEKTSTQLRQFMFDEGRAYDMGTYLEKAMWENVFAAFPEGEYELAQSLSQTAADYVNYVNEMWGVNFTQPISIKIYEDKASFLYSIKFSLPDWAGGWYEKGESIKTYLYTEDAATYEYLIRHEATHMLLSYATNDNAAYWMQEGFATTLPEYYLSGKLVINRQDVLEEAYKSGRLPTVLEHVSTNLETLNDMFDVRLYYGYSSAMAVYLLENMDSETMGDLFYELETYPYISLTLAEKTVDTQSITEKCFKKATGQTFEEFYSGFDSWLEAKLS